MKKDAQGTIIGTSRKSPYGYCRCPACGHQNVHLNQRGQVAKHGVIGHSELCPGSLQIPPHVGGGLKLFELVVQQAADRSRPIFRDICLFHAASAVDARSRASDWARYQGFEPRDVDVSIHPEEDYSHLSPEDLHDEWLRLGGRT